MSPEVPRLAHQIINLVGSVVGRAELMLECIDETHPMHADLNKILRASREATSLTRILADTVAGTREIVA